MRLTNNNVSVLVRKFKVLLYKSINILQKEFLSQALSLNTLSNFDVTNIANQARIKIDHKEAGAEKYLSFFVKFENSGNIV